MRLATGSILIILFACALSFGVGARPMPVATASPVRVQYRPGSAPRPEYKIGNTAYKIDARASAIQRIRTMSSDEFDPITRRGRVADFYRGVFKGKYDAVERSLDPHIGPFRWEFVNWTYSWPMKLRARWAWCHKLYVPDALWAKWMAFKAFAAEIRALELANTPADLYWLPDKYASLSPAYIYVDGYLNAAYNPMPLLAVLPLKNLSPDAKTDWIGNVASDSLISELSTIPGMFVSDSDQVATVMQDQKASAADVATTQPATRIGKALEVERVVSGSYIQDGDKVLINLRVVNVKNGAVEHGVSQSVPRDELLDSMHGLAASLAMSMGFPLPDESADIVIQSSSEMGVEKLAVGSPYLGEDPIKNHPELRIAAVSPDVRDWQFTSAKLGQHVSLTIQVNQPGTIYAFGNFEEKNNQWRAVKGIVAGKWITHCYKRKVDAGETIAISGRELHIAAAHISVTRSDG